MRFITALRFLISTPVVTLDQPSDIVRKARAILQSPTHCLALTDGVTLIVSVDSLLSSAITCPSVIVDSVFGFSSPAAWRSSPSCDASSRERRCVQLTFEVGVAECRPFLSRTMKQALFLSLIHI